MHFSCRRCHRSRKDGQSGRSGYSMSRFSKVGHGTVTPPAFRSSVKEFNVKYNSELIRH